MVTGEVLKLLRCPDDWTELRQAEPELIARANAAIGAGRLADRIGRTVNQPLDAGLVRAAGDLLYPIVDRIPILLRDEAIPLAQLAGATIEEK